MNAGKTEFITYNQQGSTMTREGEQWKSVDNFTYLGSKSASTEKDVKIRIAKARRALNKLDAGFEIKSIR